MTAPPVALPAVTDGDLTNSKNGDFNNRTLSEDVNAGGYDSNWTTTTVAVGACTITVKADKRDKHRKLKKTSVIKAVGRVQGKGFAVPNFEVRLSGKSGVRCITYKSDAQGNDPPVMYLGSQITGTNKASPHNKGIVEGDMGTKGDRGVAHRLYDENKQFFGNPGLTAQAEAVVVHELGHILHEAQSSANFWREKISSKSIANVNGMAAAASGISQYALKGPLEFVAEVFTALVYGRTVSANSLRWYITLGGPTAPGFYSPPPPLPPAV
jgi:hypothetical protein